MRKKSFPRFATLCLGFTGIIVSLSAAEKPNIVFILIDDLGVMDTELMADAFYETPNILRLAERGMTFTNGYCAHPRCVPSRYAIQTGRFPCRDGMNIQGAEKTMTKHATIGEAFLEEGYATFFAGKWHLGKEESAWPHHRGYEINKGGCHAGAPGSYFFPFHVARKGKADHGAADGLYGLEEGTEGEHLTDRLTTETEDFVRNHVSKSPDQPFFAFLSHYAVHTPIEGKPEEVMHFAAKAEELSGAGEPEMIEADGMTKTRRDNPDYASMVKTMDDSVGAILDLLDELKLADNTIVALTSDHGGLSNRGSKSNREVATSNLPYRAGKGHIYEGGLRVPFLVAYPPMVKSGSATEDVAVGTDLFPTLLDMCQLELRPKDHADGISLVPALKEERLERRRPLFWHGPLPRPTQTGDMAASVIRDGNLKLVKRYFPESLELYDLESDPYEETNLASSQPDEAAKLQERLEKNRVRFGAMEPRKDWKNKEVTAPLE